jgi:hypothetical protein
MKRYILEQRSVNDERRMWESERGDWIEYEDVKGIIAEVTGYVWGKACCVLDDGNDPRKIEMPSVLEEALNLFLEG